MSSEKAHKIEVIKFNKKDRINNKARQELCEILQHLCQKLVNCPEDISVTFIVGEQTTIYNIHCSQKIFGQIVGQAGKTICSLRTVVSCISARQGFRSIVEIPYFPPKNDDEDK